MANALPARSDGEAMAGEEEASLWACQAHKHAARLDETGAMIGDLHYFILL